MTASQYSPVAVAPLNTITVQDLAVSAHGFDAWLQEQTGGKVTLERIKNVAGGLPVVGNIIALTDVLDDIVTMMRSPKAPDVLMWASLGINLIGVLPLPTGTAAARMSLRPMLALVREEMIRQAEQRLKANLGDPLQRRAPQREIPIRCPRPAHHQTRTGGLLRAPRRWQRLHS
ncbi:hypothetical protein KOL96_03705 (plasmid) [Ralstonia wenshanensis]|uniref:hypothetical protein n=1 Tax=Ralstonia wenshanensis TaxID=2842456 RepID=UPI001E5EBC98|nr:hypothetical protein [Ralstonia wenshanensis]UGS89369.1 hypothetical protein KOL96_03705 [Ralstonia wenshanensis]